MNEFQDDVTNASALRAGDAGVVRVVFDRMPRTVAALQGPELVLVAASARYRRWMGREENIIGRPAREVFPGLAGRQVLELAERTMRTDEPATVRNFRLRLIPQGGTEPKELFGDIHTVPYHWPDGSVRGIIVDLAGTADAVRERRVVAAERRYTEARDVVDEAQRKLLPSGVPVLPGVQLAASYLLADTDTTAGGDWFDAFAMADGRVALVAGDVVGHGIAAAAAMGQLRVVLRDRLGENGDVPAALAAADRMSRWIRGAQFATVCAAVLDPGTGALSYCTAGHPPPLLIPAAGEARYVAGTGHGPLGTGSDYGVAEDRLGDGDLVLLYTDGIIERPGRAWTAGTIELAQVAADTAHGRAPRDSAPAVQRVTNQTVELMNRVSGHTDDITLLAAQRRATPRHTGVELPADPEALAEFRHRFGRWLRDVHATAEDISHLQHGVGELVTNAIEHPYLDSVDEHVVHIQAELTDTGEILIHVRDEGRWREPKPSADRGLGLKIAAEMLDTVAIEHDETGTTAHATLRPTRPADLITEPGWTPAQATPPEPDPFLVLDQPAAAEPTIRVDGPVDAATAPMLHASLRAATVAGTRSLTVDLSGVTHLASAGVAVLYQHIRNATDNHSDLRLYAPPGSPAETTMALVQLPHSTES